MSITTDSPLTEAELASAKRAYELDRKHVFHSWSAQEQLKPMVITRADGSYVWDGEGNKLLDFSSQLVNTNIGHQHPKVVAAIQEQAGKLCTVAPQHANDARSEAARLIAELTPGDLNRIFFTNGGADAVEHAIRMARLHTGKYKVLSAYRSYHGGTALAVNVTGDPRRIPNDYGNAGAVHFHAPFLYRSQFHAATEAEESQRALEHLETAIQLEGASNIAAIILESIPGTAGIMVPPPGYLQGVRELATKYGIIYIADEVMSGFGRAGKWFAIDHFDVAPDLLTFAKGVTSGYVPLGGVAISEEIYSTFAQRPYPGGLTYSGHPLASAAAVATINAMRDESMVENAASLGESVVAPALARMAERHPSIGEVRGTGMFWAIELVKNRATREPLAPYGASSPEMNELIGACKSRGLLPFANFNRIHVVPPLNINAEDLQAGLAILDEVFDLADAHVQG
ncbi:aspartate aminotransferase family protein [Arthrobacter crystallopoietes]|uniref:Taurine---2-oxoglutarate transaminase n=1 Tax=Crystallibacter crystallopoietes TaxID=37928 RepID=A0A1H1CZU3_9MICC|nr:aspartate aminotransferase family protein [Arthrobacter crystallopoietes]AUI50536.1 aspartate aminotransferase family protein [Arthrobacter crystallopoietes]SDQ69428.1 taurine---2-oxoglutarate transaminase [Arthrobacter crystallopoietes]